MQHALDALLLLQPAAISQLWGLLDVQQAWTEYCLLLLRAQKVLTAFGTTQGSEVPIDCSPPGPICFGATRNQQKNHRPKHFISFCILFYFFPILLVTAILAKYNGQFLQRWFCRVTSPCIFEAIPWSHPLHRAKTELLWNSGVSISSIGEDILKFHPSPWGCSALAGNRQHITHRSPNFAQRQR